MRLFFILLLFTSSWAIEIDTEFLKNEVSKNPYDVNSRLVLARSYISQNSYDQAQSLLQEVLHVDKQNQKARFLIKDIKKLKQIESLVKSGKLAQSSKLTVYIKKLSQSKQYKYITLFGDVLKRNNIALNPEIEFHVIDSYIQIKNYNKAETSLKKSSLSLQNRDFLFAKMYEKKGANKISEKAYKMALKKGDREDIVLGLYDLYVKQNKINEAEALVELYEKKDSKSTISKALLKRNKKFMNQKVEVLKKNYKQKDTFDAFKQYFYALDNMGQKDQSIIALIRFVKSHPKDESAALFLAKIQNWNHKYKQGLAALKPIINKTKNREILKLYVEMLLQSNQREKAYRYMKQLALLGDSKSKLELEKIQTHALLEQAVSAHKSKEYLSAIKNYKAYYFRTKDAKIAKEIAELYFVEERVQQSVPFYEAYLSQNPNDTKIRFRYASALDSLKLYAQAELQYEKVLKAKDGLYVLSTYRYATSLIAQKKDTKWNHSRTVLQSLLQTLQSQNPSKERDELLKFTTATLQKVSKPMPKPTRHKDVILAEGQKKIIDTKYTLSGSEIITRDIASVKSMLIPINVSTNQPKQKDVTLSLRSLEDDTIRNVSYGIRLNNITKVAEGSLSLEAKKSRFKTAQIKHDVDGLLVHFMYENFSFGIGMHQFENFNDVTAKLSYHKMFAGHNMTFGLKTTNGAFINSNACSIDNKINVVQFSLYDAILLSNLDQAEVGLTLNRYDDENVNLNTWVEYPVYKVAYENFENDFSLSGSYEFNSKTDTCYYSADFFDGNYIQTRPKIFLGKKGYIQGIGGIGYSFKNNDVLYNYGLSAQIVLNLFDIRINCRHYQSGNSPDGADECYATAAYKW